MSKKKLSFNDWVIKHIKDSINLDYMRAYLEEEALGCCNFIVEHYMDEISDEELLSLTLDAEKFALLMERTIIETVKIDTFETQIKKECKSIAKESVLILKQQQDNIRCLQKESKIDKEKAENLRTTKAKLMKSLTPEQKKMLKEVYGK